MKPRISRSKSGLWTCGFDGFDMYRWCATTPKAAYTGWLTAYKARQLAETHRRLNAAYRGETLMTEFPSFPQQVYA